ncbi:MAG: hypoxanthine phosphoribosyltransferase [Firmicutes bacterium]|nr:hypoxanthine phosphoribosyltransferase [Bacillota bacterium]MBR3785217.1 hypoxanthine phosphoribosyltransferase [Bacillota bacterium]
MEHTDTIGKILFTQEQIWRRAEELGQEISEDYAGEQVVLIGTLKGAVPFMADLMKNISLDVEIDFVAASSYGSGTESSGEVILKHDITLDLTDKHVILVEDIIDTGNTIKALKAYLQKRGPKSVSICTLLDKPARRKVDVKGDYIGFVVEDLFIVGYGLDFNQKYRNLPYISYLEG